MKHNGMNIYIPAQNSNEEGRNVTLEEFREAAEAKTPIGKLFLELLAENTWSSEIYVRLHFVSPDEHSISFSSEFFPRSHGSSDNIHFEGTPPSVPEIKKAVMSAMEREAKGADSMIGLLQERREDVIRSQLRMKAGLLLEALREKLPSVTFEHPERMGELFVAWTSDKKIIVFTKQKEIMQNPLPVYLVNGMGWDEFSHKIVIGTYADRQTAIGSGSLV